MQGMDSGEQVEKRNGRIILRIITCCYQNPCPASAGRAVVHADAWLQIEATGSAGKSTGNRGIVRYLLALPAGVVVGFILPVNEDLS